MRIDEGPFRFEWVEDWAEIPEPAAAARGWAHPGMVLSPAGTIVTFHPGLPRALELAADGALRASWDVPVVEGHGIAVTPVGAELDPRDGKAGRQPEAQNQRLDDSRQQHPHTDKHQRQLHTD